jgi:hypothetical protein
MHLSTESENKEVAVAGPMARAIETVVCESPFVVPSEARLGADEVTYMKTAPAQQPDVSDDTSQHKSDKQKLTIGHIHEDTKREYDGHQRVDHCLLARFRQDIHEREESKHREEARDSPSVHFLLP